MAGKDAFTNNGYSQIHTFRNGKATCPVPANATATVESPGTIRFVWDATPNALDYALELTQSGKAPQTFRTSEPTYLLVQQAEGETFSWKVSTRCSYGDESAYTSPQSYTLPSTQPDEPAWIADPTLSYEDPDDFPVNEEPETEGIGDGEITTEEGEVGDETPNLDDLLNTPIQILIAAEGEELPDNLPISLEVLPENPSTEQLQEAMKSIVPTCAGMVATYVCGNHEEVPQYSGEIISVAAGDEIAMNSLILSVVNIDGSGNGAGLIKVPLMNNIKLGVNLSGIQVAKGGCIVAGRAELSGVEASILTAQQREKLAVAYAVFMEATQLGIDNAGAIAKSYNTFNAKLNGIKDQANELLGKLQSGKAKQSDVEALKQLTQSTTASMQASLDAMKKAYGDQINTELAANLQKTIDANKATVATLSNFKIGRDDPAAAVAATTTLANADPAKIEKQMKGLPPLLVEYNGKNYAKAKTIKINPESLDGIIQGGSDIPLNCGFFLKNMVDGEPITWKLQTQAGTELPLEPPLRISASATDAYMGIKWPDGQTKLKLTATSGSRSVSLNLEKPDWFVKDLQVADGNRKAKAGESLYLVKAPAKEEKATINWSSNLDPMLLKNHYFVNGNTISGNLTTNKITYTYSNSPSTTTYRMNALGYDKSVKVEVVDLYKRDFNNAPPFLSDIVNKFKGVESTLKTLKNKLGFNESVVPKIKFDYKKSEYNKEVDGNRLYEDVKENTWSVGLEFKPKDDFMLPPPFSGGIPYIIQYGAFINTSITISAEYGEILKRKVETTTFKGNPILKVKGAGDITAGAKISALTVSSSTEVEFKAYGKSGVYAQGKVNSGKVELDAGISPLVFGISGKGKALGFEVFNFKKEWLLWDKTKMIYGIFDID